MIKQLAIHLKTLFFRMLAAKIHKYSLLQMVSLYYLDRYVRNGYYDVLFFVNEKYTTERQIDFLQELRELEGVKELRHVFDGGGCDGKTD